jgi:predicted butyrate kinase (DUF1464 family)
MKKLSSHFDNDQLLNLFTTAFEGGSNYWCGIDIPQELRQKYKSDTAQAPSEYVFAALLSGETVEFFDVEDPLETWVLNAEKITKGTEEFLAEHREHAANVFSGNWDAETADVWFQMCLLGELTFG